MMAMYAKNLTNTMQPADASAGFTTDDINAKIEYALVIAMSNRDMLPAVSMEVLSPNLVSSADIPTTSTLSAPTTPVIIQTLLIAPGRITGDLDMIATAIERAVNNPPMLPTVFMDVCTLGIADIAPTRIVNTATTPTIFQIPPSEAVRILLVLAITVYIMANVPISTDRAREALFNLVLSIRSDDNIASAAAIAAKTPPIAIMLFLASLAKYDRPSSAANRTPIAPTAFTPCHILSSGK